MPDRTPPPGDGAYCGVARHSGEDEPLIRDHSTGEAMSQKRQYNQHYQPAIDESNGRKELLIPCPSAKVDGQ